VVYLAEGVDKSLGWILRGGPDSVLEGFLEVVLVDGLDEEVPGLALEDWLRLVDGLVDLLVLSVRLNLPSFDVLLTSVSRSIVVELTASSIIPP
jgi:hypothetical protein